MAAPNVTLRPYRPEDADALYAAARESIADMSPWLPWCHPAYSIEEAREWSKSRADQARGGASYEFVIAGEGDRFLGGCGINQINRIHGFANLGYWVRSAEAGRGVAPAAVARAAHLAFTSTDLVRLEIVCAVGNTRSQRVAEKAGAVREGVLRDRLVLHGTAHDAVMYSLVKSRWEAR
jgi:RimJ/RimL family protein N-acetyltransferase